MNLKDDKIEIKKNENKIKSNDFNKEKLENLKNKFKKGAYTEALTEAFIDENYLYNLLPLINKRNIPAIESFVLEEIIKILCKKLNNKNIQDFDSNFCHQVLLFLNELMNAKINNKIISIIKLKDPLLLSKNKKK